MRRKARVNNDMYHAMRTTGISTCNCFVESLSLYPGNRMYDPVFDDTFNVATMEPRWWDNGGEPIWITYQKSGGKTASVYYVSDSVDISGYTATYHVPDYVESMPFEDRVEFVVGYMGNGSANLGLLYYHEPDEIAHKKVKLVISLNSLKTNSTTANLLY